MGPQGIEGPQGPAGPPGGQSGREVVLENQTVDANTNDLLQVGCNEGQVLVSGGFHTLDQDVTVLGSFPADAGGDVWRVRVLNTNNTDRTLTVFAVCFDG